MDEKCWELTSRLVGENYSRQAREARAGFTAKTRLLLEQGKLPTEGWEEREIEMLLGEISSMDSNNFPANCGVGEREDHGPSADPQLAKYGQHLVRITKNKLELAVMLKRFEQIFSRNILTQLSLP